MVSASTVIVQRGHYPTKQEVCMTVILGLSQISYDWTLRVSCGCKSSSWLRRAKQAAKSKCHKRISEWNQSPSPQELTLIIFTYQCVCRTCHKPAKFFYPWHQVFACWQWLNRIFFLTEVLFFREPPESPIVGASDIGQVYTATSSTYFKVFLST